MSNAQLNTVKKRKVFIVINDDEPPKVIERFKQIKKKEIVNEKEVVESIINKEIVNETANEKVIENIKGIKGKGKDREKIKIKLNNGDKSTMNNIIVLEDKYYG